MRKLATNCFVTTKISFANMVGDICDRTPGADKRETLRAVGTDARVGRAYLRPGYGFGGPCFPRDNRALFSWAETVGVDAMIRCADGPLQRACHTRLQAEALEAEALEAEAEAEAEALGREALGTGNAEGRAHAQLRARAHSAPSRSPTWRTRPGSPIPIVEESQNFASRSSSREGPRGDHRGPRGRRGEGARRARDPFAYRVKGGANGERAAGGALGAPRADDAMH